MKKKIVTIVITAVLLLVIPLTIIIAGFAIPAQFDDTYYGELGYMFNRLKETRGKKIVLIGNSGVAFGVRADLLAGELDGYEVVNFGLYGAIGTKAMLDLAKVNIGEGDIIIIAPERIDQSQSLYFSAENMWMAADGCFSALRYLDGDDLSSMVGGFTQFTSRKYNYAINGKPTVSGVYAQASFNDGDGNEVGYMTFDRPYNIMLGGYDANNVIEFSGTPDAEFTAYLNEFNGYACGKGATVYYGFVPTNRMGVADGTTAEDISAYYDRINDALDFSMLGNPNDYIYGYEWFYDNNFHVNSAGMYLYTDRLAEDLKAELGITTINSIVVPDTPAPPPSGIVADGDDSDEACFIYEESDSGYKIIGMTEIGMAKISYVIPATHDGKLVFGIAADVFAGNTTVSEITLQSNIRVLYDNSFDGCTRLTRLNLLHTDPNGLGVGASLLRGADNCRIYVDSDVYDVFATHYNWGAYRDKMNKR